MAPKVGFLTKCKLKLLTFVLFTISALTSEFAVEEKVERL